MSEGNVNLEDVSFSFKEICRVAKHIKPDCWCIVTSDQRLAFMEINFPSTGPATLEKQLILNNYLQLEAYVGSNRIKDEVINTNNVKSVIELEKCLKAFTAFGTCLGNRNFHRANNSESSQAKMEYWRHANCLLLYDKGIRKEECCISCLSLNMFLTKRQRQNVIPFCDEAKMKRLKTENDELEMGLT
ncbi:hypothetical protein NQ317_009404 [Molorchus minor]|uniref:Uncharacterized protein n=1 Tax=Molorchus minor TaxID=1323400 RepID=A0ABQ9JS56_9CUCU|nr:hypothetical protein NQ317_009404 [Molorchus minor]